MDCCTGRCCCSVCPPQGPANQADGKSLHEPLHTPAVLTCESAAEAFCSLAYLVGHLGLLCGRAGCVPMGDQADAGMLGSACMRLTNFKSNRNTFHLPWDLAFIRRSQGDVLGCSTFY